jgi:5-formaminoimidazole-4-carboxamide-1-(beta)-D-ribofuranosyl 5'-monophosphate synthetase
MDNEIEKISKITDGYNKDKISIGTIGSHSALSILNGAKEEGFRTVCIVKKSDELVYKRFQVADEIIHVENFKDILNEDVQDQLLTENTILIPHGSFNAYVGTDNMMERLSVPMFGNKDLLHWETNREMQRKWLQRAGLKLPEILRAPDEINSLVIVKFPGARGGKGYFIADSKETFLQKSQDMIKKGHLVENDLEKAHIQEYIIGVNIYPSFFHSVLDNEVELLGMDKRYESTADNIGRIPADEQISIGLNPTYTIVGNIPITIRESLLPIFFRMAEGVVKISKELTPRGIIGPFCLETVITEHLEIVTFEISARIVAGTNVGIGTSPYAYLKYGEGMYMGRRIAREIKKAVNLDRLKYIVT